MEHFKNFKEQEKEGEYFVFIIAEYIPPAVYSYMVKEMGKEVRVLAGLWQSNIIKVTIVEK